MLGLNPILKQYFSAGGQPLAVKSGWLVNKNGKYPIIRGIPRFTPNQSYSSGNFSRLRDNHAKLQLDSANGTRDRLNTLLNRTRWPRDFFKDKTVLECGCGAGPDTEILLDFGAKVLAVDIAGVDVAARNLAHHPKVANLQLAQDSIANLHLKPKSFDIVFCHRVLQHTPNPVATLRHILRFVKPGGAVFVHSYSDSRFQRWRWKYALLPLTNKLPPALLYNLIKLTAWPLFYFTNLTVKVKGGQRFNHMFIPFLNYRASPKFAGKPNSYIVEYGIHDTFDALSPRYDNPLSAKAMQAIAGQLLDRPFEIHVDPGMTLLRSKVGA